MIHLSPQANYLVHAHILDALNIIPDNSIQAVITSPPYWGMRHYKPGLEAAWPDGLSFPFGIEPKPEQYIERTRHVLGRLMDKLKDNGVIWWNIRDAYFTRAIIRDTSSERLAAFEGRRADKWKDARLKRLSSGHDYLKDKDLTLIPFLVAYEAQKIGYWVRSIIIWEKENLVPEPKLDRPVLSHEYVLLLTKSRFYKWNKAMATEMSAKGNRRQVRSVWTMRTSPGSNGHPAPFPESLVERCMLLSTDESDIVLDPFIGSGTTALVADRLGRRFIGVDIVKSYLSRAAQGLCKKNPSISINWYDVESNTYNSGGN